MATIQGFEGHTRSGVTSNNGMSTANHLSPRSTVPSHNNFSITDNSRKWGILIPSFIYGRGKKSLFNYSVYALRGRFRAPIITRGCPLGMYITCSFGVLFPSLTFDEDNGSDVVRVVRVVANVRRDADVCRDADDERRGLPRLG